MARWPPSTWTWRAIPLEAIEGIFSPDGRVFGKMGHLERRGPLVGKNIPGEKHQPLFESGAEYFK